MFCTNCGASNKDDAKLCVSCSESLSETQGEKKLMRSRELTEVSSLNQVDFFHRLFDFSFSQCVNIRLMRFLYGLSILSASLIALFFILVGFKTSMWLGMFALLIGAPMILLLTAISGRVFLEMILAVFRAANHMTNVGMAKAKEKAEPRDGIQWNV